MEEQRRYRSKKHMTSKQKGDRILNYLIALVVGLIILVAGIIFSGGEEQQKAKEPEKEAVTAQPQKETPKEEEPVKKKKTVKPTVVKDVEELKKSDTVKVSKSDEAIVDEVIEDKEWKPYKTAQQDDGTTMHVSSYSAGTVDWNEKLQAVQNITGLKEEDWILWYAKGNGSADASIITVSSKDQDEKYRVSLKWVAKKGWKPEKVEVLNQLQGAY